MSRFFPRAESSEDQPLSHTILGVHVLTRGATTGAIIGAGIFAIRDIAERRRAASALQSSRSTPNSRMTTFSRPQQFLRTAGTGTAIGTALLALALVNRMHGRQEIEWKDRSWRLVNHQGQVECDDFTYMGAIAGLGAAVPTGAWKGTGWRGPVGAAGFGSVIGTVGYMAWRHGIKGGQFDS